MDSEDPNLAAPSQAAAPRRAEHVIALFAEKLAITANARAVYGEPVHAHNRTVIPVAMVGYGMGAGAGRAAQSMGSEGGGGAVGARGVGYIEISDRGSRYVAFSGVRRMAASVGLGMALGYVFGRIRRWI